MRSNSNVTMGTFYIIFACILVAVIVLLGIIFMEYRRTGDYEAVDGVITDIYEKVDYGREDRSRTMRIKLVDCEYEVDGEVNTTTFRTLIPFGKQVGDSIKIHYSSSNPMEVRKRFTIEAGLLMIGFLAVFSGLLAKIMTTKMN